MAWTVLYDGLISGASLISPLAGIAAISGAFIPYANGQRVLVMEDGT